jgi:phenylpropionate dioxygenase-like ring-hydroxylating dioxygenase large terminal subunit
LLTKADNELITRTGPGTPMGDLMRRYWIPALLTEEVPMPDCPPVQVRILGEELVAFRDSNGVVGLIGEHCSHRGTSLFYGRNEDCGLRCIYHGWKYDAEGHVLDTPAEPADSTMKRRILHPAYPTHEAAGIVFAYLGPRDKQPVFPDYQWAGVEASRASVTKSLQDCNYLQGLEGECDSSHLRFLHTSFDSAGQSRLQNLPISEYLTEETDFGVRLIALRDMNDQTYVRVSAFVMPVDCWIPNGGVHFYIPAQDDEHSWRINLSWKGNPEAAQRPAAARPSERWWTDDYRKVRNIGNHYLQDRDAQREVNYTGMGSNFVIHDSCATESMGPLYDRSKEHLGVSDTAVIAVRAYLLKAVKAFQAGAEAPNVITDPAKNHFPHVDSLVETIQGSDWHRAFPHLTERAPL